MSSFVGIDLGTTYSVVAYINANGRAEVIPNEQGKSTTPSVVYFDGQTAIVGDDAKEQQALGKAEVVSFFKRSMGDSQFRVTFHERTFTPIDLSAFVLTHLKAQAEHHLGTSITDAVITVPAYFTHVERTATIEAGRKAGLNVLKIISEPTAAALAYGLRPSQNKQRILVYDLGGGTFDVSLVAISPDAIEVIGTDGDHNLGGKDWDDCLIGYVEQLFEEEFAAELIGDDVNELRVQVEKLKYALSMRQSAEIRVHAAGNSGIYTVTREQFENITRQLIERTQILTERVLEAAHCTWQDINGILPVGGSTRMPMVRNFIEQLSGKPPMGGIHPDEAVALGAAIQASMELEDTGQSIPTYRLAGRKATVDVIAHSLGMIAENGDRSRYINSILLEKNKSIPSSQSRPYQMTVRRGGNTELEVFLTQGENENPQQCAYLGRYVFSDFPQIHDKRAVLDITYTYDKNGTVQIGAVEHSTGQPLTLTVYPVPPDVPARFAGRPSDVNVREHLTVYLVIDTSGSMDGEPIEKAKQAANQFVDQCDLSSTSIGLITFAGSVHLRQAATQNGGKIHQAIRGLSANGGTNGEALHLVYKELNDTRGIRYAIVLTDGQWNGQGAAVSKAKQCHEAGIEVIAIGLGGADRQFLDKIASSSEQSFFTDLSRLTEAFSTIAQELTETGGEKRAGGKLSKWI